MKRTALTGLFLTAALLGSPVFAADDLCGANIQTIKDAQVSTNANLSSDSKDELKKTQAAAEKAKAAGDEKECIAVTTKVITDLKTGGAGTDTAK